MCEYRYMYRNYEGKGHLVDTFKTRNSSTWEDMLDARVVGRSVNLSSSGTEAYIGQGQHGLHNPG